MANEFKVRKGLIVQGSGSAILDIFGSQGQLFSVTDSLSGSLFSVNDISGIPIMEVFSDNTIKLGTYNQEAIIISGSRTGMGTALPQAELHISGANNDSLFRIQSPASSSILFVSGSGNVGIGTLTPTQKVSVDNGNVGFTSGFGVSWDSDTEWIRRAAAADQLQFATQNTVRLNIGSTQGQLVAIGLGATTGTAQFQVRGGGATSATTAMRIEDSGGNGRLTILDDGTSAFNISHLYISSSGRIGIGTATPTVGVLDINGIARVRSTNQLYFGGTAANDWQGAISGQSGGLLVNLNLLTINNSGYASPATQSFVINTSQNVAIGPHSPTARLHVSGASSTTLLQVSSPAQTNILFVSGSGNVGIGTATPTNTLQVVGGLTATSFTGSLLGTASLATTALTASNITPAITNNTDNYLLTATGGGTINGESKLSYDGLELFVSSSNILLSNNKPIKYYVDEEAGQINILNSNYSYISALPNNLTAGTSSLLGISPTKIEIRSAFEDAVGGWVSGSIHFITPTGSTVITNEGRLGLGIGLPSARLHISGASNSGLLEIDSPAVNNIIYVSGSGNVGIGTGTPTNTLQVVGGVTATSFTGSLFGTSSWAQNAQTASFLPTGTYSITSSWATNALTASFLNGAFLQNGNSFGATAVLGTNDNQNLQFETNGTVRMHISSSGNVGVGLTNPSARLHISGAAADRLLHVGSPSQANILFVTGSGRVGIGTDTPSQLFEIVRSGDTKIIAGINVGIQTGSASEWIHLSSSPVDSKYIRIDATQTSLDPPFGNSSTDYNSAKVYGNVDYDSILSFPDYWMEIKLGAAGPGIVLIPCYLPE